jgi:hypothetical protein
MGRNKTEVSQRNTKLCQNRFKNATVRTDTQQISALETAMAGLIRAEAVLIATLLELKKDGTHKKAEEHVGNAASKVSESQHYIKDAIAAVHKGRVTCDLHKNPMGPCKTPCSIAIDCPKPQKSTL